ncbi:hypothetical protein QVD17_25844 [Tagetes erecta]|uniref:Receptor ligand binding region domain-containing protein n=1 Tax=Tagetes erecta TaxID=13708 RepID=A0AAD8K6D2_TARER|nr:hypothetical protein QVD17_25844 [Tagetes erecta]
MSLHSAPLTIAHQTNIHNFFTFSSGWCLQRASLTSLKGFTRIGVILDQASRPGKEAKVSIEIAIQEFNNETNQSSVLYIQNSRSKPIHAAIAAKELIDKHNVKLKAILGGHAWEEASTIPKVISESVHHWYTAAPASDQSMAIFCSVCI